MPRTRDPIFMAIGERLRTAREACGYATAKEAAQAMDARISTYSQHEAGGSCQIKTLCNYAAFYGVEFAWLVCGCGWPSHPH